LPPFFVFRKDGCSLIRLTAVVLLCLMLAGCFMNGGDGFGKVIHGGGVLWEYDSEGVYRSFAVSNSREAFLRCAQMGECTAELDFCFTADGELVCIHDWDNEYFAESEDGVPLTLEEFCTSRIFGCFTPMTASDAAGIMEKNGGLTLVTDIKEDFYGAAAVIAEEFSGSLDRVIIQIYRPEQYGYAADLGFTRIAYTLYCLDWDEKLDTEAHIEFARSHRLEWIAFSEELGKDVLFIEKMKEADVPLYVHTVNSEETEKELSDKGIAGVYTDRIR